MADLVIYKDGAVVGYSCQRALIAAQGRPARTLGPHSRPLESGAFLREFLCPLRSRLLVPALVRGCVKSQDAMRGRTLASALPSAAHLREVDGARPVPVDGLHQVLHLLGSQVQLHHLRRGRNGSFNAVGPQLGVPRRASPSPPRAARPSRCPPTRRRLWPGKPPRWSQAAPPLAPPPPPPRRGGRGA